MKRNKLIFRILLLIALSLPTFFQLNGQGGFDNSSRALYIFDFARYVDYGEKIKNLEYFKIGVLADDSLMLAMGQLRRTRPQTREPVDLSTSVMSQILFLHRFSILIRIAALISKRLKKKLKGNRHCWLLKVMTLTNR